MRMRIGILGAGGVGGYTGGHLSLAGEDVTLIGQRQENVAHIRSQGVRLVGTHGERVARPAMLHVSEVQQLTGRPLDAVLLCVKSYDTPWASALIAPFLAPDGCIVSMQNGMNEEPIAAVVGWERTIGVVMSSIGVNAVGLGQVIRTSTPGGDVYTVFRVGRPDGQITPRVEAVVHALRAVDSTAVTTNLLGERWSKLVTNSISHGLSAATGLTSHALLGADALRPVVIGLAAEGIRVGQSLGYALVPIYGTAAGVWMAAAQGDPEPAMEINRSLTVRRGRVTEQERPSVAQDLLRGRRTDIEYTNGLLVRKAHDVGLAVPLQEAVLGLVRRIERRELTPDPRHLSVIARTAVGRSHAFDGGASGGSPRPG
jgi:2-dehydropantoate 2-reductase